MWYTHTYANNSNNHWAHSEAITDFGPRDSKHAQKKKKRDRERIQHEGFLQPNVHCPQKRWWLEAHNQSQCLPGSLALQDGGQRQPERCFAGRRLHGNNRTGRCLPFRASSSGTSRFPKILLEAKDIPVQIPPIHQEFLQRFYGPLQQ